ncbi:MAG: SpoIIE family protein phosphatase [Candidatus Tumulicola sp.]
MSSDPAYFQRIVFESSDCVKILDAGARLVSMNENGRIALCIKNFADVAGADWRMFWTGEHRLAADDAIETARGGGVGHFVGRYDVEGRERWWDVTISSMPGEDWPERMLVISRDVTAFRLLEAHENRRHVQIEKRLRAIDAASTLLSSSLDFQVTLSAIADIAVDTFATLCAIQAVDEFEKRQVVVRSRRPDAGAATDALRAALDARSRDDDWLSSDRTSPLFSGTLGDLDIATTLTVPIVHNGIASGALTLFVDEADRQAGSAALFDTTDRLFAEELGRRAGVALANARSFGRERSIAVRMQESALPNVLPRIDHLHLSAAYRPSSSESTIGGDWFDAFELSSGHVAMSIGDVGGHGLAAALIMTKIRQAMRVAALLDPSVGSMLRIADQTLRMDNDDVFATAIGAIYDPVAHRMEIASAGHPGPLVRYPDGRVEEVASSAPLLGLGDSFTTSRTIETAAGTLVVFFTDGLIEFDRDIDAGFARLESALADLGDETAPDLAQRILDRVIGRRPTPDDVAILTAYIAPAPATASRS